MSRSAVVEPLEERRVLSLTPFVWTDKPDYAPGDTATFYGSGFQAGETIDLQITVLDGNPLAGQVIETFQVVDGGPLDLDGVADGNLRTEWVVSNDAENAMLELTMTGLDSGVSGMTTFTDAGPLFASDVNGDAVPPGQAFNAKTDVYINGDSPALSPGQYFVRVTTPSGQVLGTSVVVAPGFDPRPVVVTLGDEFFEPYQLFSIVRRASNPSQIGFDDTNNPGLEYRVQISQLPNFLPPFTHSANFKVLGLDDGASVSGVKFHDLDESGTRDQSDEPLLEGWTIYLDAGLANGQLDWVDMNNNGVWDPGEGERWTVTDANGAFQFDDVLPGSYVVREVQQQYWVQTTNDPVLNLGGGDTVDEIAIGNFFDASLVPDPFEPNNSADEATVLGSKQAITLRDLTIHSAQDEDFFQVTPPQTGYTIINAFFSDADADLDIQLLDEGGNVVATSTSATDNERMIVPVAGQHNYVLRVLNVDGGTAVYDLEIEHFAAPVPTQVLIDPADDTGVSDGDNNTRIQQPRIVVNADLSIFASLGGTVLDAAAFSSGQAGLNVEVLITDIATGATVSSGVADPVSGDNTLFEFTPGLDLADGTYLVRARVVANDGERTVAGQLSLGTLLVIDTTNSAATAVLHNVTVAGGNAYAKTSELSFFGAGEPGGTARVVFSGTVVGEAEIGPDESHPLPGLGAWQLSTIPVLDGTYSVEIRFLDVAGNPFVADPIAIGIPVIIDTVAPQRPTIDLLNEFDTGYSDIDNITAFFEPTFRISAEPGTTVVIKDGETIIHTINNFTPGADGFLDVSLNFNTIQTNLGIPTEGPHPLSVESTDLAGNRSAQSEELLLTIDRTPPSTTGNPSIELLAASDSGSSNSDRITKINQPAFYGTAEANAIVRVYVDDGSGPQLVGSGIVGSDSSDLSLDGLGLWEVTVEPLADGEYEYSVEIEDAAGHSHTSSPGNTVVIDTLAPQRPTIDLLNDTDTGLSHFDNITRLTEHIFRISAEPGTTVVIKDGETVIRTINNFTPNADGFFDVTLDFDAIETNFGIPAEGPHPLSVESTDTAGNRSAQAEELLLTIDTTDPILGTPPIFLLSASDSGKSDSDGITNIDQPAFSGYAEANTIVRIFADGGNGPELIGTGLVGSDESDGVLGDGLGLWEITVEPLADGEYDITLEVEDIAGNVTPFNPELTIEIDTLAPQRPTIDLLDVDDTGMHDMDRVTRLTTLQFRISAEPDSRVVIKDGEVVIHEIMSFTPDADGFMIVTIDFLDVEANFNIAAEGPHPLSVEAFDCAGNRSHQSEEQHVTIDTTAPGTSTPDLLASSDSGLFNDDNVTNVQTPAFSGVAEANAKVRVYANGELVGEGIVNSDESFGGLNDGLGIWEVTVEPLVDGEYDITVEIEDLAGNISVRSEPLTIWIDTIDPNRPVLDLIQSSDTGRNNQDNITNDNTPTVQSTIFDAFNPLQNTFTEFLQYRIFGRVEGQPEVLLVDSLANVGLLANGNFLDTLSQLIDGVHNLKLEVEDLAGNIGAVYLLDITVDTAPPPGEGDLHPSSDSGVPGQGATNSDRITNDTTPLFYGTAESNAKVTVFIDGVLAGGTVAKPLDGNFADPVGHWQVETNLNLPDGLHEVTFVFEDVAGNTSTEEIEIFIDTQAPIVTSVVHGQVSNGGVFSFDGNTNLLRAKPGVKTDPLIHSIVINFEDQPERVQQFLYDALNGQLASNVGNYSVVGDHTGHATIVQAIPTFTTVAGQPALAAVELVFAAPLADDRFTLTISDNLRDDAGNRLDGESNNLSPGGALPSGDGTPGGSFSARFTVDSRPELAVYSSTTVYVDTNGNGFFDPFNSDAVNRDIAHKFGLPNDTRFAGKFSNLNGGVKVATDGYDKLGAYGFVNGQFRWIFDTNNDGVPDLSVISNQQVDGIPIAGNFNKNANDGDEIGLFTGEVFLLDTTGDYQLDTIIQSNLRGYPIAGDFDGDGIVDLATYNGDKFYFDFFGVGGWNGQIEDTIEFGFDGVVDRPVAADMDADGITDIGLFAPGRRGTQQGGQAEWFFLVSGGTNGVVGNASTLKHEFTPVPFGNDLYYQYGEQFALPLVGNFDPPIPGSEGDEEEPPTGAEPVQTTVGLYDPSTSVFFLRNENSAGSADAMFSFGPANSGWVAITGDWDGDGTTTIGLYNPDTSTFFLRNENSAGAADSMFNFGPAASGWLPVVGDWDGDGTTTIGLFDPVTSSFFLRNSNSSGAADEMFSFGPANSGWTPLVGDWDGDGTDTVGFYGGGVFFLRNSHDAGAADEMFNFGPSDNGWTPVVGDWNADGTSNIGLYSGGAFFLRNSHDAGPADDMFAYGPTDMGWKPVTGSWQGPGQALQATGLPAPGTVAAALTTADLSPAVDASIARWQAAGLNDGLVSLLERVDVQVADLPGSLLGLAFTSSIVIDVDAAGFGWYAGLDEDGLADDQIDLLTVIAHEFGHVLGLEDLDGTGDSAGLMVGTLSSGVRREPTPEDIDALFAALEEDEELLEV